MSFMKPAYSVMLLLYRYLRIPFKRFLHPDPPAAFVLGFSPWKSFIDGWFPGQDVIRRERSMGILEFYTSWAPWMLANRQSSVYVWGYKNPHYLEIFCRAFRVPLYRVEDGFIRSVALGAEKAPPLSLCFDTPVLYYDAAEPSRLETLLQTFDFCSNPELVLRAEEGIKRLITSRISKYNSATDTDIEAIYGPKDRKRVLVVGQVEGDMSIIKGCDRPINNNDLVRIAARENFGAQIIYKPHPEVILGIRKEPPQSKPDEVRGIAMILDQDITLADAFQTVDHVYTITSLSGFEALIRGIKVTCVGMPFYAGWGATDDRQTCDRRTARRTPAEIFAAAYLLYPKYFDPILRKYIEFEEALEVLAWMRQTAIPRVKKEPKLVDAVPTSAKPETKVLASGPTARSSTKDQIKAMRAVLDALDPASAAARPAKTPAKPVKAALKPFVKKKTRA